MFERLELERGLQAARAVLARACPDDPVLPARLAEALAARDHWQTAVINEPTTQTRGDRDLYDELAASTPATFDKAVARLAVEHARREFLRAAVGAGATGDLEGRALRAYRASVPDIVERVRPAFDRAVVQLERAAVELPAGPAAVDPAMILDADAGSAHRRADDALGLILACMPLYVVSPPQERNGGAARAGQLAVVVDIPDTTLEVIAGPWRSDKNNLTDEQAALNHSLRRLDETFHTSPALGLIDVARGAYPGLRLDLAGDADAFGQRLANLDRGCRIAGGSLSARGW